MGTLIQRGQGRYLYRLWAWVSLICWLSAGIVAGASPHAVSGIYVLGNQAKDHKLQSLLATPGVAGISFAVEWKVLEPIQGQYAWEALDARIAEVAAQGKRVTVRMFPGVSTPEWVYASGARAFEFIDQNPFHGEEFYASGHRFSTYGQTLKIPVPWDEVFLTAWERFIAAAGARYKDSPTLAMVHITGPTRHSAEMHLPKDATDKAKWLALGYTPQKLIGAWQRCINAFAKAFPTTPIVLNVSPVIFDDEVMEAVAQYGYEHYGRRFFLQNNILMADNKGMKRQDWGLLKAYATKTTIGFQRGLLRLKADEKMSAAERLQVRRANFDGMLMQGMALGAKYFEVGAGEVRDFPDIVNKVVERLEK